MTNFQANLASLFLFILFMVAFSLLTYISVRHIDRIESMLSKSQFVTSNRLIFSRAGVIGKVMRIYTISILLMIPGVFARRGLANLQQIREFPRRTRLVLVMTWAVLVISLILFGGLDYFER